MRYLRVLFLDMKNLFTNLAWLFYAIVFPLLLIGILGYLTRDDYGIHIQSYDYYGVTLMIFSILNTATIAANAFMEERIKRGNLRIVYSPISSSWIYMSKIISAAIFDLICHLFVIVILVNAFEFHLGNHYVSLLILMIIGELFSAALGVCMCCLLKSESLSNQILSLIIQLTAALGGVFFSLERFGHMFTTLSYLSPIKWMIQSCFLCIYDQKILPVYLCISAFIVGFIICIGLCQMNWKGEDCL